MGIFSRLETRLPGQVERTEVSREICSHQRDSPLTLVIRVSALRDHGQPMVSCSAYNPTFNCEVRNLISHEVGNASVICPTTIKLVIQNLLVLFEATTRASSGKIWVSEPSASMY